MQIGVNYGEFETHLSLQSMRDLILALWKPDMLKGRYVQRGLDRSRAEITSRQSCQFTRPGISINQKILIYK